MISKAETVDQFLKAVSPDEHAFFTQIRKQMLTDQRVIESMAYRMPTYKIGTNMVGAFNKQKNYLCLYLTPAAVDLHREALGQLDCGKSCIRFKRPADLPFALAAKIIAAAVGLAAK